jgi:hypothetical protein
LDRIVKKATILEPDAKVECPVKKIAFAIVLLVNAMVLVSSESRRDWAGFATYSGIPGEPHGGNAMWIEPSSTNLSVDIQDAGYKFNVTLWVNLTSVPSAEQVVTAWQFALCYNKSQLNATRCAYTTGAKSQFFSSISTVPVAPNFGDLNATHGFVMQGESWSSGPKRSVPGFGSLSWVEFEVVAKPPEGQAYTSLIGLITNGTRTCKVLDDNLNKVPFTPYHSVYRYGKYDVTITAVVASKTAVGEGYSLNITVTVKNNGSFTESFNVTVFANGKALIQPNGENSTTVTLTSRNSTTITFTWNTTGFAKGNYTISAYAWPVQGETDKADNTKDGCTVLVSIAGDMNGDHLVDISDLVITVGAIPSSPTINPEIWNSNADINNDGVCDVSDLVICVGTIPSGPW